MREQLFSKHHVGGRNGRGGFPLVPALHGSLACTVYEADASCCPQIETELSRERYAAVQVVQECIGLSDRRIQFNLNYDPYTSSILSLNPKYQAFYWDQGRFDYTYSVALSSVRQIQMSTVSLDDIETKHPIDFLSLDTQGSELDVLRGAVRSLSNAVGVETEVSFRQIYEGSALFGEVCAFLNGLGFEFICFTNLTVAAPRTLVLLGRARKLHTFGDALFLRSPRTVVNKEQKRKLIFAALAYGQTEYAAHCVSQCALAHRGDGLDGTPGPQPRTVAGWVDFVDEFVAVVSRQTAQLPPGLSDVMSLEESFSRFDAASAETGTMSLHPIKLVRRLLSHLPPGVKTNIRRIANAPSLIQFYCGRASELEALFQRAGLSHVAEELRRSRFRRIFPLTHA